MAPIFQFLKTKQFFIHLALSLFTLVLLLFGLIKYLSVYTGHSEFVTVPDFMNARIADLNDLVKDKEVNYIIIDSVYDPQRKPGIVIRQDPLANTQVKHNRNVYLYVTSMVPPQVLMPKLIDRSERQARLIISSYGLKAGTISTKSSDCNGCILEQLYKGQPIEPGTPIKKGSKIDLVVGVKDTYYTSAASDTMNTQQKFKDDEE